MAFFSKTLAALLGVPGTLFASLLTWRLSKSWYAAAFVFALTSIYPAFLPKLRKRLADSVVEI